MNVRSEDGAALEGMSKTSSAINDRDSNSASSGADNKQLEMKERGVKCTQCKYAYENLYTGQESIKMEISLGDIEIASLYEHVAILETAQNTKNMDEIAM